MIKLLLKHKIAEICIDTFFNRLTTNFLFPQIKTRSDSLILNSSPRDVSEYFKQWQLAYKNPQPITLTILNEPD